MISVVGAKKLKHINLRSIQNWRSENTIAVKSFQNARPNVIPNGSSDKRVKKSTAQYKLKMTDEVKNNDTAITEKSHENEVGCRNDAVETKSMSNETVLKESTQVSTDRPFDWNKVAKELHACHTFEDVVSVVRRYILSNIRLHRKYRQTVHDVICQVAMVFYPSDHPPNHVLNETYGDGNCFFRAVSHALFGTEERHVEICVRIVFEAILNETLHLNSNYLSFGMKNNVPARPNLRRPSTTIVTRYCLYSGDDSIRSHRLNEMEIQHIYRQDIMQIKNVNNYAGIWQFHQAAEVGKMPIGTVYPERGVNENIRLDMNKIIQPSNHAFHNKIPMYIMWSPLSKKSKAYNVKHFVVLFEHFR